MILTKLSFRHTAIACYFGMISQAIVNNLAPLLFIIFKENFGISDEQLGRLILFNFGTQIITDILATRYADRIGYRVSTVLSEGLCALGLILMGVLPRLLPNAYTGLCLAAMIYAVGGGFIEVIISPIIESLPGEEKTRAMSLAHSFYCWGQMAVVAITTLALWVFGKKIWAVLPLCWAIVPFVNMLVFCKVPLKPTVAEDKRTKLGTLLTNRAFILGMIMMVCSGSSEIAMSQWSSLFVEETLGVSKVVGDLLGPCMFAFAMALGRVFFGIHGEKIKMEKTLALASLMCVACYLVAIFIPALTLVGCALCGLAVAIMWPGTLSGGARRFPLAGTAMFGLYAICGDIGCSVGPWLTGVISDAVQGSAKLAGFFGNFGWSGETMGLKSGLLCATIFPIMLLVCALLLLKDASKAE